MGGLDWTVYIVWIAALFFAGSWTFGLIYSPRDRIGSTIVTVILWWVAIALAASGVFSAWHLLWLFPASLLAPALLLSHR
jgi:hypothetical protein